MPSKRDEEIDEEHVEDSKWGTVATKVFILLLERGENFTADSYYELCLREGMPEDIIARTSGSMFKKAQASSWIRKTSKYKLSTRTSAPLPLWTVTRIMKEAVKESRRPA